MRLIAAGCAARADRGEPRLSLGEGRAANHDREGKADSQGRGDRPAARRGRREYRPLIATGIGTGLRLGELVGLRWQDVPGNGFVQVRMQVNQKGRWAEPKTPTAVRAVVLSPQLGRLLAAHKIASRYGGPSDPVFASAAGTPLGHDTIRERGLEAALTRAKLDDPNRPKVTMHSLRDTFASHLIVDLGLDVVQVSRQLGHANPAITAKTYVRMFDEARHADAIRNAMEASHFGAVLEPRVATKSLGEASAEGGEAPSSPKIRAVG